MSSSEGGRKRLASAILVNWLLVGALGVAVASPLFLHFTGFEPVSALRKPPRYPWLVGYRLRTPPDLGRMHGLDFSQVWQASRDWSAGDDVYHPVDFRKWRREWSSTYHPLTHWLYIPISQLRFSHALVIHNLAGISLLLLCGVLALRRAGCLRAFPSVAAVSLASMYLTPTGLLHLERGQLDIFVAAAMLCVITLFSGGGRGWAVATAVISTLKVSAWPFIALYSSAAVVFDGLRKRGSWWLPATLVALNLVFLSQVRHWIPAFLYVAGDSSPAGPTFGRVLPAGLAQTLPLASTLLVAAAGYGALRAQGYWADVDQLRRLLIRISFPFGVALALQTICATPVTHDYRLVALLGLLPVLPIWCVHADSVAPGLRQAASLGFAVVLALAMRVQPFTGLSHANLAQALLASALGFLALALYLAAARHGDPQVQSQEEA